MKHLLLLALVSLSPLTVHAEQKITVLDVSPWAPADCLRHDYPLLNEVYEIEKLSENEASVTFGLKTTVGSCQLSRYIPSPLSARAVAHVMRSKTVLFQKHPPVIAETKLISPTTAYIKLTFDKKDVFKKRDEMKFMMTFYPEGLTRLESSINAWGQIVWTKPEEKSFLWNVTVARVTPFDTQLYLNLN